MWQIGGKSCQSRLMLGTAHYPSLDVLCQAVKETNVDILTVSLKRENASQRSGKSFWEQINTLGCNILPNTAGCRNAKEAIYVAQMAQEIFETNWIKLEVIGDELLLQPDTFELVKATEVLLEMGFEVFPFCTEDYLVCKKLVELGCQILMPWGSPIGSGKGILQPHALKILRERFSNITLIVDAGMGSPLHALQAMLLGFDGVLINSAVANATDPVAMARAFKLAIESGHIALHAGLIPETDIANTSTPLEQTIFGKM
jgi:thiazole synthase